MMDTDPNSNRLAPLLQLLLDGSLSAEQWTQLREILATNPAAAEQYIDFVTLHALLESELEWNGALQVPEIWAETSAGDQAADRSGNEAVAGGVNAGSSFNDASIANQPPPQPPPAWEEARKKSGKSRRPYWYGLAASLLVGLTIAILLTRSNPRPPMATLASTVGAEWESPNASLATGAPMPEGLLELKAGLAEVRFKSGASMIVQGPARFRVLDDNSARLAVGKLTATVPPEAHGFTIQTSVSRIVDLGTEFGVEMRNDYSMRAEVFRGRVEMYSTGGRADAAPTLLTANHAVEISTGGLATVPAAPHPERFVRAVSGQSLPPAADGPNYDRWLAFSRELRQDTTLVLYYTLEDTAPSATAPTTLSNRAVETAGQFDVALAEPNAPALTAGRWAGHGIAMDFVPARKQRLLLQNYPPAKDGLITVMAWVYARSRPTYGNIVNNWGKGRTGQFHLGLWTNDGDLLLRAAQPHGPDLLVREGKLFPIGRWCQVACTADGTMVRLYRDGVEVAAIPSPGLTGQPVATTLGIGFKPGDNGRDPSPGPDSGFWDGKIDEVAIFHRALSPEEIRASYQAGRAMP